MQNTVLKIDHVTHYFGGLRAVSDFNMELPEGAIWGLIGPNGAGKTTIFNLITGVYIPTKGKIYFRQERKFKKKSKDKNEQKGKKNSEGKKEQKEERFYMEDITRYKPHTIVSKGIARTFQNLRIFPNLTVLDNIRIAEHFRVKYGLYDAVMRNKKFKEEEEKIKEEAIKLLKLFNLHSRTYSLAKGLPYGELRRLEIARALATHPKLLLLDEPAAGMNPKETQELMDMILWIRKEFNLTIFLIEHHMKFVMGICEHIKVMDFGETIAEGTPQEVSNNPRVIEAYLGRKKYA